MHFWPYVTQIYVPAIINDEGKTELSHSFALTIPDIADLELFCEELPVVLRRRGTQMFGYRPRDCVVDLAIESALDVLRRLRDRLNELEGERTSSAADIVLGIDVVHVERQGNNIRLLGSTRLDPEQAMIDEYSLFRDSLWNPLFRRQRLFNLINHREWYAGFDNDYLCTRQRLHGYSSTLASPRSPTKATISQRRGNIASSLESLIDRIKQVVRKRVKETAILS